MGRYILRRLLLTLPVLLGVAAIAFLLTRLTGDPSLVLLPPDATETHRKEFSAAHGLDRPVLVQFGIYVGQLLRGQLGKSFSHGQPALELVLDRFPATLALALGAMAIVVGVAVPAGVVAAARRGRLVDTVVMASVLLGQSVATFWLGLMLILIFAVRWPLFPPSGRDGLSALVLPSITLAMYFGALLARMARASVLEVLSADYLRTARAKGLNERRVLWKHSLRNALIPVVTVFGVQAGALLGGAVVTETVFSWPGVGSLVVEAIYRRDYAVVQTAVLISAVIYSLINLGVDVVYAFLDPRIRYA